MNKVALITGAYKGLGFEIARQLGQQGITVVIGARELAKAQAAADKLKSQKIDARGVKLDVTNPADVAALPGFFRDAFGRLDILINNAGVMIEEMRPGASTAGTLPMEKLRETFDANFFSAVAVTQALLPLLKAAPAGRIVNHSSILGSLTLHADPKSPIYGMKLFAYDASKTALNAFTVHLAFELRDTKVKVNSAHPGWVKTDLGTSAAPMEVVEGAKTAVALATLGEDGPSGAFVHLGKPLPW